MFGILQKMDRFSNGKMDTFATMDFCQELIDCNQAFKMADKYRQEIKDLLTAGLLSPAKGLTITETIKKLD